MAGSNHDNVANAVIGGSLAFGAVGLVVPQVIIGTYGLPNTGPFRFLARLWGTRTATLGAIALLQPPAQRRQVFAAAAAMNAVDTVVSLSGGHDLSRRTRVMAALTSASFAVAAGALAADLI
jgi:hypothetical protein